MQTQHALTSNIYFSPDNCSNVLNNLRVFPPTFTAFAIIFLSTIILEHILDATVARKAKGGKIYGGEIGIPTSRDGKVLPCGIFGRWESK